jgi:hypothetical protein
VKFRIIVLLRIKLLAHLMLRREETLVWFSAPEAMPVTG